VLLRFLVFAVFVPLASFGQSVEFGVKAGVPLSDAFETGTAPVPEYYYQSTSATRRYTIGPVIELGLWHSFSMEFDVLYKRLGFDAMFLSVASVFTRTVANSWEFPILGKYRFLHMPALRPYVDGGVSFRRVSGVSSSMVASAFGAQTSWTGTTSVTLNDRSSHGGAVGVGADIHAWLLHISPELRYTRWGADRYLNPQLHSNQNQIETLVGIAF
jgi:hypothetical protein